jgi:hypothetical protein
MASENSRTFATLKVENVEAGLTRPSGGRVVTDGFDVLNFIDFKWDVMSTRELCGHFTVTPKTCQVSLKPSTHPKICSKYSTCNPYTFLSCRSQPSPLAEPIAPQSPYPHGLFFGFYFIFYINIYIF